MLQLLLRLFSLGGQLLALLLDLAVFAQEVVFELLVDEGFSADEGLDVFDFGEEGLFGLVEDAGLVGDFSFGFLGEVGDFDFSLLLDFHEVLLDLLYLGLVFGDFLVELFLLEVFLLLGLFDVDVEVLLLFEQLAQLVLVFELVRDEAVELLRGIVLDELD